MPRTDGVLFSDPLEIAPGATAVPDPTRLLLAFRLEPAAEGGAPRRAMSLEEVRVRLEKTGLRLIGEGREAGLRRAHARPHHARRLPRHPDAGARVQLRVRPYGPAGRAGGRRRDDRREGGGGGIGRTDSRGLARLAAAAGLALALALAACSDSGTTGPDIRERGDLISATLRANWSTDLALTLLQQVADTSFGTPRYAVAMYAITYATVGPDGTPATASAGVYLPISPNGPVPLMSYSHGTVTSRTEVPSNPTSLEGEANGVLQSSLGNVLVAADYLGLGQSDFPFHPYLHAASEASAGLDALRAARELAAEKDVELDGHLFIYGYSQGGQAAMALARELELNHGDEFTVTAAAPMSGPYDMYGSTQTAIGSTVANEPQAFYAVYTLAAWNRVYGFASHLDALLKPPYDALADQIATTGNAPPSVLAQLAPVPRDNLQPAAISAVLDEPDSELAQALKENDTYGWAPTAPMRLYYGSADTDVPPQNALTAAARMKSLGADVEAEDLGPLDHRGAVVPAIVAARAWFDTFLH